MRSVAAPHPLLALLLLATSLVTGIAAVAGTSATATATASSAVRTAGASVWQDTSSGSAPVMRSGAGLRRPAGEQVRALGRLGDERLGWRRGGSTEAGARQSRSHPFAPLLAVLFLTTLAALTASSARRDADRSSAPLRALTRHPSRGPPAAVV